MSKFDFEGRIAVVTGRRKESAMRRPNGCSSPAPRSIEFRDGVYRIMVNVLCNSGFTYKYKAELLLIK